MIRCRSAEMMDQHDVDPAMLATALGALNRTNHLLLFDRRIRRWLMRMGPPCGPRCVLDLGAGGGSFLGYLSGRGGPSGPRLIGLDRSAVALRQARSWHDSAITWVRGDGLRLPFADAAVDIVTCSLFLHHFDEDDAVRILREAGRVARRALVVSDLVRSQSAWILTWLATHGFSRSEVFRHDGPVSVRAAYTPRELRDLARKAGLHGARVHRQVPLRMRLTWRRPEGAT